VTEPDVVSVPVPNEVDIERVYDKTEGKRKLDAVPEITEADTLHIKARTEVIAHVESVQEVETVDAVVFIIEVGPSMTDNTTPKVDEIPLDLEQKFEFLRKKYNRIFLDRLTVSQVCEEYDKCVAAFKELSQE